MFEEFPGFGGRMPNLWEITLKALSRALNCRIWRHIRRRETPGSTSGTGGTARIACSRDSRFRDSGKAGNRLCVRPLPDPHDGGEWSGAGSAMPELPESATGHSALHPARHMDPQASSSRDQHASGMFGGAERRV